MGGLLAFRVGNYDNTAEREQFRFLCEQLKAHYENSNEFCVFAGNYNIGCELDALFIKKDAIIAIEFKNYGGKVIANENGEWTCDGKTIKGGSRKTVLQQARVNHSILKNELKVLGVKPQNIKDVPTLVIFNQPVEITNNLSATNKSWLHITDNEHFIEKLDDITCPHTDLDPLGIVNLAELLNLNSFFLTEFSNANYDKPVQPSEHIDLFEDIKKYETKNDPKFEKPDHKEQTLEKYEDYLPTIENTPDNKGIYIQEIDPEMLNYKKYFEDILNNVLDNVQYHFTIYRTKDIFSKSEYNLPFEPSKEFTLYAHANNIILGKKRLENFLRHEIYVINENELCWEEGENIEDINPRKKNDKEEQHTTNSNTSVQNSCSHVKTIKVSDKTDLPEWLDNFIFNELNACYAPDHIKHEHNLHLEKEDVLNYLGTYFPRSYIESLHIYRTLFSSESFRKTISNKNELNVLDFGCGTAGEIFGLVSAIEANLPNVSKLHILAIDGNQHALRIAHKICTEYSKNSSLQIKFSDSPVYLQEKDDLRDVVEVLSSKSFDFILSFKTIGELVGSDTFSTDNPYKYFATIFSPLLSQTGVLLLEDVTIKNEKIAMFLPKYMNIGINSFLNDNKKFRNILPVNCLCSQKKCSEGCFFKSEIRVNHSRKQSDLSKIAYRMIAREALSNAIHDSIINQDNTIKCKYIK